MYRSGTFSPLGFGHGGSRFSDPRDPPQFGVVYVGSTVEVCFVEAILRDKRNGVLGQLPIPLAELNAYKCAKIAIANTVTVIDLVGPNLLLNGVPTDVVGASDQSLARAWSVAFHEHPARLGGVQYESRLIGHRNLAFYDRALSSLRVDEDRPLLSWAHEMAHVIRTYQIAII